MRFGVLVFPGSNCDDDCRHVLADVLGQPTEMIWHGDQDLSGIDVVVIPGGFSYGDYLRTGAIARSAPVMTAVQRIAASGRPILGICNGFQILLEAGLLPGAMLRNRSLKFICEPVTIRAETDRTPFTRLIPPGTILRLPIAHAEGNYYVDSETLSRLRVRNQIVFRYCDSIGKLTDESNPNGSLDGIAGICNEAGNIVGMMPHPERFSEAVLGGADGRRVFESVLEAMASR